MDNKTKDALCKSSTYLRWSRFKSTNEISPKDKGIKIKPDRPIFNLKTAINQIINNRYIMEADFNTEIGPRKQSVYLNP